MPCRDASAILVESRMQLPIAICSVTQLMSLPMAIGLGACPWPPKVVPSRAMLGNSET
jgi:hypothetical protein